MTTLNSIYEYGEKFNILSDKYYNIIIAYSKNYFSKINNNNIYIYFIIFLIYLSIFFTNVNNLTKDEINIKKTLQTKETDISWAMSLLFGVTYSYVLFNRFLNSNFSISSIDYKSIILLSTIVSFYYDINKQSRIDKGNNKSTILSHINEQVIINLLIAIPYLFLSMPLLWSSNDIPDVFYIGVMVISSGLYLYPSITRNNLIDFIKNKSIIILTNILIYSLFSNISNKYTIIHNMLTGGISGARKSDEDNMSRNEQQSPPKRSSDRLKSKALNVLKGFTM